MHWMAGLYRDEQRALYVAAWSIVRRHDLAEDAVHSAVVRLLSVIETPREPKLYALRAVRHAALDLLQQRRRTEQREAAYEPPSVSTPPSLAIELREEVAEALRLLDPPEREVVELRLQAGLEFRDIAELLGEPLPTVASRYRRALIKLQERAGVSP